MSSVLYAQAYPAEFYIYTKMTKLSKESVAGYAAGITTGVTYGLNPLFAVPLMRDGANVDTTYFSGISYPYSSSEDGCLSADRVSRYLQSSF